MKENTEGGIDVVFYTELCEGKDLKEEIKRRY